MVLDLNKILLGWTLATILFLTGCAASHEPFDYQPDHDGIQGPGILSGEDGLITIFRGSAAAKKSEVTPESSETDNEAKTGRSSPE